jgi:hypothetical protein
VDMNRVRLLSSPALGCCAARRSPRASTENPKPPSGRVPRAFSLFPSGRSLRRRSVLVANPRRRDRSPPTHPSYRRFSSTRPASSAA